MEVEDIKPHKEIGLLIKCINEYIEKDFNNQLKKYDLTVSQVRVLHYLQKSEYLGKEISQKDIENYFEISHPTTVGIVKRLETKGFIRCEFNSKDKRTKNIYLTPKASELNDKMELFGQKIDNKIVKDFSEEEKLQLYNLLYSIYNNVKNN